MIEYIAILLPVLTTITFFWRFFSLEKNIKRCVDLETRVTHLEHENKSLKEDLKQQNQDLKNLNEEIKTITYSLAKIETKLDLLIKDKKIS